MKVFWFTNIPHPEAIAGLSLPVRFQSGGWLTGLSNALTEQGEVELALASHGPVAQPCTFQGKRIRHFLLPPCDTQVYPSAKIIAYWQSVIHDFAPDMLHIHGTESYFGLLTARGQLNLPAMICIQGVIEECARVYCGRMTSGEIRQCISVGDILRRQTLSQQVQCWERYSVLEREIFSGNNFFDGRTDWDRAQVLGRNPAAQYYHVDRILRAPFYTSSWQDADCARQSILLSTASYPLKGTHWLLRAVAVLAREFPGITVRVADNPARITWKNSGYLHYLHRLAYTLGIADHITWLPMLDAAEMAEEMCKAHVVVVPSLVENQCNTLCEAMLLGVPTVTAYAGGMLTTARDGVTTLNYPSDDYYYLANCLRRIFTDDTLARRLATEARAVAQKRHQPATVVSQMLGAYHGLLETW